MSLTKKISPIVQVTACAFAFVGIVLAQVQAPTAGDATNSNPELVGQLIQQLNDTNRSHAQIRLKQQAISELVKVVE